MHTLDVTGTLCPVPLLLTARAMASLAPGEQLEVVGDDLEILTDMPAWCEKTGHRLIALHHEGSSVRCLLEKAHEAPDGRVVER